jgi:hypothetical protein
MEISYEQWRNLGFLTRVLSNHSGRPDKNYELKKIAFIEFPVICIGNLKFYECRIPPPNVRCLFCGSLDSAARSCRTNRP